MSIRAPGLARLGSAGGHSPLFHLWRQLSAAQLFVGSFALLILLGTLGLKLLPGIYTGEPLTWLDALFTATSAVCVTGLVVVDTATYFTTLGQAWILLLIQLGGLGIVTFSTIIIIALGRRLSLRQESLSSSGTSVSPQIDYRRLTRDIFRFTFLLEAIGAILLLLLMGPRLGWGEAVWPAVFHSISAFCNAGFSTFSDSLISFRFAPGVLSVVMTLIVVGGIGFVTLEELYLSRRRDRPSRFRLSLHSRIVLVTTAILIVGGWAAFAVLEWERTLADMPFGGRLLNALFLSVTSRTAGFNTIDYATAGAGSNFLTILLMAVGGSPGSTAGGLKTTTVALIGLLAWSRFRGTEITSVSSRSVPEETVQRAVGLFVVYFGVATAAILALIILEVGDTAASNTAFLPYMFEVVSAFNTVGLSMNTTPLLSESGRLLLILLMYVGRVGPLTFAAAIALSRPSSRGEFRYAYEDVVVG